MIVFCADLLYTPLEEINEPILLVEDGRISSISSRSRQEIPRNATVFDFSANGSFGEASRAILVPGFLDVHIHGSAGIDVMRAPVGELPNLNRFLARRGVTGYFPTTVAASLDETCRALERLADAIESAPRSLRGNEDAAEARPLGIHLEGPFLSHQRRGVHPPEYLIAPTVETFERLWQAARGQVKMMTIAPELSGAPEVIAEAARRNVCVSIGHSDAKLEAARAGVRAGARHATHTFNAMRPLDHRDPGILGEVLTNGALTADIIADGIHLAPEIVKLFLQAKGFEKSVLITDATAAAGMPDGKYQLGPIEVEVKDGKCTSHGSLAGSVLTMDRAVWNTRQFAGWSLKEAVRAATMNPANAVGLEQQGRLAPGVEANIVVLTSNGEIRKTIASGRVV
jgi:N-acetylglucosamine-6-phosphate deacetylase